MFTLPVTLEGMVGIHMVISHPLTMKKVNNLVTGKQKASMCDAQVRWRFRISERKLHPAEMGWTGFSSVGESTFLRIHVSESESSTIDDGEYNAKRLPFE